MTILILVYLVTAQFSENGKSQTHIEFFNFKENFLCIQTLGEYWRCGWGLGSVLNKIDPDPKGLHFSNG